MVYRSFICYHSKYHWDLLNFEWYYKFSMIYRSFIFTIQSTIETNKCTFDVSMVLNGTERYWRVLNGIEWYWMVFEWYTVGRFWWNFLLLKLSLRPNKHHWHGQWYWMVFSVLNGIPFVHLLSFKIPLRPAKYWMVLQMLNDIPFVYLLPFKLPLRPIHLPLTFSMTPNGIERYWMVPNGTSSVQWYTVRCLFYHPKYHWTVLNGTEGYWMVLNGIWMVYRWPILMRFFIIKNIIKTQ